MNLNTLMNADATESTPAAQTTDQPDTTETTEEGDETIITHEKKTVNPTALALFIVIVVGAAGTYFMHLRTGPQSAAAATDINAAATVNSFLTDGRKTISTMWIMLEGTQKLVDQFKTYPSVTQVPLTELKANPFHLSNTMAPPIADSIELAQKKKEEQKLAALQAAQTLQLQSLMRRGTRRMAMINNSMYLEGDSVDGFIVEKITATTVVVRNDGYRFELRMSK